LREGYVQLAGNPAHKRSGLVRPTDRGKALCATLQQAQIQAWEGLRHRLSDMELASAAALLSQIHDLLASELPRAELASQRQAGGDEEANETKLRNRAPEAIKESQSAPNQERPEPEEEFPINLL
jgi:DNA-binding MarR family transcriptional regulator